MMVREIYHTWMLWDCDPFGSIPLTSFTYSPTWVGFEQRMTGIFVEESPGLKMLDVGNGMWLVPFVGTSDSVCWKLESYHHDSTCMDNAMFVV